MHFSINQLDWDSELFGYKVGEVWINDQLHYIQLEELFNTALALKYRLVYVKSALELQFDPGSEISKAISYSGKKITFQIAIQQVEKSDTKDSIRQYSCNYLTEELLELAFQSGEFSRFRLDPNFRNKEFEKLYHTWIQNSVSDKSTDEVWVSDQEADKINGLVTIKTKPNLSEISLLAVSNQSRKQRIGTILVEQAKAQALKANNNILQVSTQADNIAACNLYKKSGFKEFSFKYINHLWL